MSSQVVTFIQNIFGGSGCYSGATFGVAISILSHLVSKGAPGTLAGATGASTSFGAILGAIVGQNAASALAGSSAAAVSCAVFGWLLNLMK